MFRKGSLASRSYSTGSIPKSLSLTQILDSKSPGFVFRSSLLCPFANLAIEDYIFRHSPSGSKLLLFYRNNKSIVIGRNQNPWLELNLQRIQELSSQPNQLVHLLRRRSGGGTVYHDRGTVNWSFTCDASEFNRNKYAELIVQALHGIGIDQAKVNNRHDIVVVEQLGSRNDTSNISTKKVSGSAYKISRQRALHHGTALLNANLQNISELLHSPARSLINARGTESIRSPVTNLKIGNRQFEEAVEQQFRKLYNLDDESHPTVMLGQECLEIGAIRSGYEELRVRPSYVEDSSVNSRVV
jgi:lipoate---protein ligase